MIFQIVAEKAKLSWPSHRFNKFVGRIMRVLINTPYLDLPGGVSSHYLGLRPFWSSPVSYNEVVTRGSVQSGAAMEKMQYLRRLILGVKDYASFTRQLIADDISLVVLNPSFHRGALMRDAAFLRIAKAFGRKVIVFFHGWDHDLLQRTLVNPGKFTDIYDRADAFLVLGREFLHHLRCLGITKKVFLTTTKVDDRLLYGFDLSQKDFRRKNLLFLARIERGKGVYIAVEAFRLLKQRYDCAELDIVGVGSELAALREHVQARQIPGVNIKGALTGDDLKAAFRKASVYVLPTDSEGMPTSVIEAMAFGIPVVTRPVGGLKDFFLDEYMGFATTSKDPVRYFELVDGLFGNPAQCERISRYNHKFAKEHFLASIVAGELEKIFAIV